MQSQTVIELAPLTEGYQTSLLHLILLLFTSTEDFQIFQIATDLIYPSNPLFIEQYYLLNFIFSTLWTGSNLGNSKTCRLAAFRGCEAELSGDLYCVG